MHLSLRPAHVARYRDVALLLARHGRSDLVKAAGLNADGATDDDSAETVPTNTRGSADRGVVFVVAAVVSLVLLGWIGWKSRAVRARRRG